MIIIVEKNDLPSHQNIFDFLGDTMAKANYVFYEQDNDEFKTVPKTLEKYFYHFKDRNGNMGKYSTFEEIKQLLNSNKNKQEQNIYKYIPTDSVNKKWLKFVTMAKSSVPNEIREYICLENCPEYIENPFLFDTRSCFEFRINNLPWIRYVPLCIKYRTESSFEVKNYETGLSFVYYNCSKFDKLIPYDYESFIFNNAKDALAQAYLLYEKEKKRAEEFSETIEVLHFNTANKWLSSMFIESFKNISKIVYENAIEKGFFKDGINDCEKIVLMHSELSEAIEALRINNPPDKHLPQFDTVTVELADCVIRIMDYCEAKGFKLSEAIIEKIGYNKNRPYKHNKEF